MTFKIYHRMHLAKVFKIYHSMHLAKIFLCARNTGPCVCQQFQVTRLASSLTLDEIL